MLQLPLTAASHLFPLYIIIHLKTEKSLKLRQLKKFFFYFTELKKKSQNMQAELHSSKNNKEE